MSDTLTTKGYLIVRASGDVRTTKTKPRLRLDEIAFPLIISIPKQWGRIQTQEIQLTMPEPPEALVFVGEPEGPA